ncbi:helix-turn-helix domain-containing protein, partial [Microbacterium sp.]|uniref:helix-turn-helix domain-containing protein n=1 Tax=Microbacterium sp. TaxID=51671 RepID=UPI003C74C474
RDSSDRGSAAVAWERLEALAASPALVVPALFAEPGLGLTPRRRQVAERAAAGCRDADIARELGISPRTVNVHVSAVLAALGASSRRQLAPRLTIAAPVCELNDASSPHAVTRVPLTT